MEAIKFKFNYKLNKTVLVVEVSYNNLQLCIVVNGIICVDGYVSCGYYNKLYLNKVSTNIEFFYEDLINTVIKELNKNLSKKDKIIFKN